MIKYLALGLLAAAICLPMALFPQSVSLVKIVSGGQTGVDRAALDFAIAFHIPHGGFCPKGRLAEDGTIPEKYHLIETESAEYHVRTYCNVKSSDGTLIIVNAEPMGGTLLTIQYAEELQKPCYVLDLSRPYHVADIREWIAKNRIKVLNVAGPRASQAEHIYTLAYNALLKIFEPLNLSD